jgi:ABC-type sugar transport system substrate-binding protein
MNARLWLSAALAGLAAVALAVLPGCSRAPRDDRIVLGFSQIGAANDWRRANSESIKSAAATSNIDLRFADADNKQENQIRALREFIASKVDVIAFAPVVETGWDEVLNEAKAAKIPVILTDRTIKSDPALYAGFLGSDFVEEGRKAGRWVTHEFANAQEDVSIVELRGTDGAGPAIDRARGFAEVIAQNPRLKIVRSAAADFTRDKGKEVMAALLSEKLRPRIVFAHNDDMALGAISALEAAGLKPGKDVLIVSVDAVRAAFVAMIDGKLNASIECNPLLGPQLMTSVTEVVAGRPIPKRSLIDEATFTMDVAKQHIQSRKY